MNAPSKPNLLYLLHRVPYPPNRGDRIRSYHMLRFLSQRANVYLATLADEPVSAETRAELARLCSAVEIFPVGSLRWARAAWSLASGKSATEGLFASPGLRRAVADWAGEIQFDAVLVFCSSMMQYADLPGMREVPAVCDLVDVDSQKWHDYAAKTSGLRGGLARYLFTLEGDRLRKLESSLPKRCRAVTLVSEAEARLFRGFCPNDRTVAIPNGVDLDYFHPQYTPLAPREEKSGNNHPSPTTTQLASPVEAVFVGVLDYRANVDGLVWFCTEVWPLVLAHRPQATLSLVGKSPAPAVTRLAELPGVRVVGPVPDVRPHLAAAKFAIAPLRIARGIQNKVLEAMAMARPVLASPAAAEGLDVSAGEDLLVADLPDEWAASFCRLTDDAPLRQRLGNAARDYVEQNHTWPVNLSPLAEVLSLSEPAGAPLAIASHA